MVNAYDLAAFKNAGVRAPAARVSHIELNSPN